MSADISRKGCRRSWFILNEKEAETESEGVHPQPFVGRIDILRDVKPGLVD